MALAAHAERVLDPVADRLAALLARRAVSAVLLLVHVALAAALFSGRRWRARQPLSLIHISEPTRPY